MTFRKRLYSSSFAVTLALIAAQYALAQTTVRLPRPSQKATVTQTIGVTDVTITYSRPGVKGRRIWGDPVASQAGTKGEATLDDQNIRPKDAPIVPWGHVWRTGANEATQFVITDDVLINGQKLPAGSYSLHTIPTKEEWTTQVLIRWEKVAVPFTVEVPNVEAVWRGKVDAAIAADPNNEVIPLQVANAYVGDDKWDEALKWIDQSIKVKQTFRNMSAKAQILYLAGRKDEAFALADQAIAKGKADKVDTANFEKRVANWKAAKM